LSGLYPFDSGDFGRRKDIRSYNITALRKNFWYCASSMWFVGVLFANIAYGKPSATVLKYLKQRAKAYALDLSMLSQKELDTIVASGVKTTVGKATCCMRVQSSDLRY